MYRWLFGSIAFVSAVLIGVALYFEHVMGMEPCPLCVLQRIVVIIIGVIALFAATHNPGRWGLRVYAGMLFIFSVAGAAIAGRHVWLQNLPKDQVPECGPGLDYIMEVFSVFDALSFILKGSGECAEASWAFLGLTIPGWTLVIFTGFVIISIYLLFSKHRYS